MKVGEANSVRVGEGDHGVEKVTELQREISSFSPPETRVQAWFKSQLK